MARGRCLCNQRCCEGVRFDSGRGERGYSKVACVDDGAVSGILIRFDDAVPGPAARGSTGLDIGRPANLAFRPTKST
jgi:hypothetical protein